MINGYLGGEFSYYKIGFIGCQLQELLDHTIRFFVGSCFQHLPELARMGARIRVDRRTYARINGATQLTGAKVLATDLRASACLVLAGLVADGQTLVDRIYHLDRGYERMELKLQDLGAHVERIAG